MSLTINSNAQQGVLAEGLRVGKTSANAEDETTKTKKTKDGDTVSLSAEGKRLAKDKGAPAEVEAGSETNKTSATSKKQTVADLQKKIKELQKEIKELEAKAREENNSSAESESANGEIKTEGADSKSLKMKKQQLMNLQAQLQTALQGKKGGSAKAQSTGGTRAKGFKSSLT